jgi:hypothetical protein
LPTCRNHRTLHDLATGFFVFNHFNKRHQVRRIPEMRADNPLPMLEMPANLGRGNRRTVAGEHGCRRHQLFKLGEYLLFQRQLLRRRLENPVRPVRGFLHRAMRRNALEQARIVVDQLDNCL